jgi:hypothetical protein
MHIILMIAIMLIMRNVIYKAYYYNYEHYINYCYYTY